MCRSDFKSPPHIFKYYTLDYHEVFKQFYLVQDNKARLYCIIIVVISLMVSGVTQTSLGRRNFWLSFLLLWFLGRVAVAKQQLSQRWCRPANPDQSMWIFNRNNCCKCVLLQVKEHPILFRTLCIHEDRRNKFNVNCYYSQFQEVVTNKK